VRVTFLSSLVHRLIATWAEEALAGNMAHEVTYGYPCHEGAGVLLVFGVFLAPEGRTI